MPPFAIRRFPDPVLRKVSDPIKAVDRKIRLLIDHLIETMYAQPGGVGIAAPQVGVLKRIAVVDVSPKVPGAKMHILINPRIVSLEQEGIFREGCMSVPDFTANVKRAQAIMVEWQDLDLRIHQLLATGLEARCIQHEVDHLNGFLFVDRVGSLKSDVFPRKRYL